MAGFFRNRGYPSNVVQRAQERVSAIPRDAIIISERSDVTGTGTTIPLVLTYHPTNAVVSFFVFFFQFIFICQHKI